MNGTRQGILVAILATLGLIGSGCSADTTSSEATIEVLSEPTTPTTPISTLTERPDIEPETQAELESGWEEIQQNEGFEAFKMADPDTLFAAFSGVNGGIHRLPVLYLDEEAGEVIILVPFNKLVYPIDQLDRALSDFTELVIDQPWGLAPGPPIDNPFVVDSSTADAVLTPEQTEVYDQLRPSIGYAFLAGALDSQHSFPLLYSTGFRGSAEMHLLGPDLVADYPFGDFSGAYQRRPLEASVAHFARYLDSLG